MRTRCILTLASGVLLAQCASRTPAPPKPYSSPAPYQSYTCAQLDQEAAALTGKSTELSAARQQSRWSVPFLGGDPQAANTRLFQIEGQLVAIDLVRKQKTCR